MEKQEMTLSETINDFKIKVSTSVINICSKKIERPVVSYTGEFEIIESGNKATITQKANKENVITIGDVTVGKAINIGSNIIITSSGNSIISINSIPGNRNICIGKSELDVIIPDTTKELKIDIDNKNGNVEITNLMLLKLIIKNKNGNITLEEINSVYSKIETMNGTIKARLVESMLNYEVRLSTKNGKTRQINEEKEQQTMIPSRILKDKYQFNASSYNGDVKVFFEGKHRSCI